LLEKGADIKAIGTDGGTALHWAAYKGHETAMRLLLEKGADIKAANKNGATALYIAAQNGHKRVVRLLEIGAGIKALKHERTAQHWHY
jgi:uncharacterized protein